MPTHVIYGDSFLVAQQLKELESDLGEQTLLDSNYHRLQGGQVKLPELLSVCNALPFMDPLRLILVEGLLGTFESRSGAGRSRGGRSASSGKNVGDWDALAQAIPQMPDTTRLVFIDGPISASNPLLQRLKPVCVTHPAIAPTREMLSLWIKNNAQQKGAGISPAAIRSLADLVGSDLWTLDRELEKLSLYCTGRNIEEDDVRDMVSQIRETSIFNAVDAIIDGNAAAAFRLLRELLHDGRDATYIISMVGRQLRLLSLVKYLTDQGVGGGELGSKVGINSQFALRKTMDQARRHSWPVIRQRYQRLLDADLAIKRGRQEPDLALELLVADLIGTRNG
ncbi:MAG: DNA polymerase III subunit delta [Chloroflexi bacterium]|nr:DNA polymerase III subunit delta [Chloroflexota bacterium]MDA1218591.1 DNA polymerase III subunit delta [Chloroflexota bacterium]PKB58001.1 MAG: DNA polymerase III subunit delta [SAR202 cluster bacterium Casp-Chloro-G3]